MLCSEPKQRNPQRGAAEGRPPLWRRPKAASFVLALNKAHVLALNTAHVLRLNKADVLALNKAHVLRLNSKICPVLEGSPGRYFSLGGHLKRLAWTGLNKPARPIHKGRRAIARRFFDFFIPLSAKTYTFESISGKQLSRNALKSKGFI